MAKEKLITKTQLKKSIQNYSQNELIDLIADISQACPQAREFLTVKFADKKNIKDLLEKYKQKVKNEFFPTRGFGRLNLREAKKAISDFKRICPDKTMSVELMLFYVENCVAFTDQYGDINESFYNSAISAYSQVINEINSGDMVLYEKLADRLRSAAKNACHGWGFYDCMMDLYYEIIWLDESED